MINYNNFMFASGLDSAIESLTGWPLAVVICVGVICFASMYIGRWPWERED